MKPIRGKVSGRGVVAGRDGRVKTEPAKPKAELASKQSQEKQK